jgi:GGDEF domain-containing protein
MSHRTRYVRTETMVSLTKYILGEQLPDLSSSLLRVAALLLEGTALHAVDYDRAELATFQSDIRRVRANIEESTDAGELLALGGEAMRDMENYNRRVERTLVARRKEVQSIMAMMTQTLLELAKGSETSAKSLHSIEAQLDVASKVEDIRLLKTEMATCLKTIRTEADKQKARSSEILEKLERTVANRGPESGAPRCTTDLDPITGLGSWGKAEESAEVALARGTATHIAVVRLDRLDMINKRFGNAAGNQALLLVSQHVAQQLANNDELFRWRGPAFVALLDRQTPTAAVRVEMTKMFAERLRYEVANGSRTMLLPLPVSWTVFELAAFGDVEALGIQLDTFTNEGAGSTERPD